MPGTLTANRNRSRFPKVEEGHMAGKSKAPAKKAAAKKSEADVEVEPEAVPADE